MPNTYKCVFVKQINHWLTHLFTHVSHKITIHLHSNHNNYCALFILRSSTNINVLIDYCTRVRSVTDFSDLQCTDNWALRDIISSVRCFHRRFHDDHTDTIQYSALSCPIDVRLSVCQMWLDIYTIFTHRHCGNATVPVCKKNFVEKSSHIMLQQWHIDAQR